MLLERLLWHYVRALAAKGHDAARPASSGPDGRQDATGSTGAGTGTRETSQHGAPSSDGEERLAEQRLLEMPRQLPLFLGGGPF